MKLTRRGRYALALAILAALVGLFYLVDHVNYMGAGRWCFHSLLACDFPNG
jgi:hypothetical protein